MPLITEVGTSAADMQLPIGKGCSGTPFFLQLAHFQLLPVLVLLSNLLSEALSVCF